MDKPTVGRIVHFHTELDAPPQAALVVALQPNDSVNLSVCDSSGGWRPEISVPAGEREDGPFWVWPPRV